MDHIDYHKNIVDMSFQNCGNCTSCDLRLPCLLKYNPVEKFEVDYPSKKHKTHESHFNKFLISYQQLLDLDQENVVEIFRKRLYKDIIYHSDKLLKLSSADEDIYKELLIKIRDQVHKMKHLHQEFMRKVGRDAIMIYNIKRNKEWFSHPIESEDQDSQKQLVIGPNGTHHKRLSNTIIEMLKRNNKSVNDLWMKPDIVKNTKWLMHGETNFKKYKCWCHRNIYMKKYIKTELMKNCNTNTTLHVCVECGRVWKDVDDYVCYDFVGYTKVDTTLM